MLEPRPRPATQTPPDLRMSDLRSWLADLAARGRLAVARENLPLADNLAAVAKRTERDKAVLFPHPVGADGKAHDMPVVVNLFTQRAWVADALGVDEDQLLPHFLAAAAKPTPCVEVTSAPVQEVVHTQVDLLAQLPIPSHNELDSGPYITAGLLWLPGFAAYYCNGEEIGRWEHERICAEPSSILFTMPIGGWDNESYPVDSELPADFAIDYVRVWQRADLKAQ